MSIRRVALSRALPVIVFVLALGTFRSTLPFTLELRDEGYIYFNIARAASGEVPHRDFIDTYGPGVYAVTGPVYALFGERILPVRELMAAFRAAGVTCAYLIAARLVPLPFALLAAAVATAFWGRSTYYINVPYAVFFTIPLCMASLVALLRALERGGRAAFFGAGLLCGAGALFKWSLAAVSAFGMGLAILASAMLAEPAVPARHDRRVLFLVAWAAAGCAIVAPFVAILMPFEYLLHFAPIHALLALLAIRFAAHGDGGTTWATSLPRAAAYGAGFALPLLLVAGIYLGWGALGDLFYDVVVRPMNYRNYHTPIPPPPFDRVALLVSCCAWTGAALAWLGGRRRPAIASALAAAALTPFGVRAAASSGGAAIAVQSLGLQTPAMIAAAGVVLVMAALRRRRPAASDSALAALIAALFFQEMMTFEIFPRGDNVTAMAGVLAPVLAALAHRGYVLAGGERPDTAIWRRGAAFALAAAVPLLFVAEGVRTTVAQPSVRELASNALLSPALAGIRPKPKLYRGQHLAEFDALVAALDREPFDRGPLFLVTNEPMIYFATRREPLFAEHTYTLFLAGWGLLPENDPATPSESEMIEGLDAAADVVVITREPDPTTANFRAAFPEVSRFLGENFTSERRIGRYELLRRAPRR